MGRHLRNDAVEVLVSEVWVEEGVVAVLIDDFDLFLFNLGIDGLNGSGGSDLDDLDGGESHCRYW